MEFQELQRNPVMRIHTSDEKTEMMFDWEYPTVYVEHVLPNANAPSTFVIPTNWLRPVCPPTISIPQETMLYAMRKQLIATRTALLV